jgi:hypothetical protein
MKIFLNRRKKTVRLVSVMGHEFSMIMAGNKLSRILKFIYYIPGLIRFCFVPFMVWNDLKIDLIKEDFEEF